MSGQDCSLRARCMPDLRLLSLPLPRSAEVGVNADSHSLLPWKNLGRQGVARLTAVRRIVGAARRSGGPYPPRRSDAAVSALFDNFLTPVAAGLAVTLLSAVIGRLCRRRRPAPAPPRVLRRFVCWEPPAPTAPFFTTRPLGLPAASSRFASAICLNASSSPMPRSATVRTRPNPSIIYGTVRARSVRPRAPSRLRGTQIKREGNSSTGNAVGGDWSGSA